MAQYISNETPPSNPDADGLSSWMQIKAGNQSWFKGLKLFGDIDMNQFKIINHNPPLCGGVNGLVLNICTQENEIFFIQTGKINVLVGAGFNNCQVVLPLSQTNQNSSFVFFIAQVMGVGCTMIPQFGEIFTNPETLQNQAAPYVFDNNAVYNEVRVFQYYAVEQLGQYSWNQFNDVKVNVNQLAVKDVPTEGDILIYDSVLKNYKKLSAGAATTVLTSNGLATAPSWQAGGGGATSLVALTDTEIPDSTPYVNNKYIQSSGLGQYVQVTNASMYDGNLAIPMVKFAGLMCNSYNTNAVGSVNSSVSIGCDNQIATVGGALNDVVCIGNTNTSTIATRIIGNSNVCDAAVSGSTIYGDSNTPTGGQTLIIGSNNTGAFTGGSYIIGDSNAIDNTCRVLGNGNSILAAHPNCNLIGTGLTTTNPNSTYVDNVRNNLTAFTLYYDPISKEISYA